MPKYGLGLGIGLGLRTFRGPTGPRYIPGLYGKRYTGYFGSLVDANDNVNWFATATRSTGTSAPHYDEEATSDFTLFSSSPDYHIYDNYSWQWTGYFRAPYTDTYTFSTVSDDCSYLWIGDNARAGFTRDNATVNSGGQRGYTSGSSTPVVLTGGVYYPIRIQYGEHLVGDRLTVKYSTNSESNITDWTGKVFHITTQDLPS